MKKFTPTNLQREKIHRKDCNMLSNVGIPSAQKNESYCTCVKTPTNPPTETVSDYKNKCDCACHLVVPDELNNCDCTRFHNTPLSEHDLELIREGRSMSDRDTRRGV